jgi:hypothetical protein
MAAANITKSDLMINMTNEVKENNNTNLLNKGKDFIKIDLSAHYISYRPSEERS